MHMEAPLQELGVVVPLIMPDQQTRAVEVEGDRVIVLKVATVVLEW